MTKKLITFSLWGDDDKYCIGACRNVVLAQRFYPDWTCRFYVDRDTVPMRHLMMLSQTGNNTELLDIPKGMEGWKGMFARFLPASEDGVDVFISRDCDSRLGEREAAAVQEWMASPRLIHAMRDHPHHTTPILGGMWGAKYHAIPDMQALMYRWDKEDRWQTDQEFLRDIIWRRYHHKVLAHDDWGRFGQTQPFPIPRENQDFVGAIIGVDDERLHPEHHGML
jgi:protein O-GlcNAc transferase